MRRISRRIRLLASFVAIGWGVLLGKSGSWALARYQQVAFPLKVDPDVAARNATVTVVIPAFKESSRIAGAIECLQRQTYPLFRAVIVDDASPDDTAARARSLAEGDPRFTILRLLRNSGLPAARNVGLASVATEFVLFLDADDYLTSDALASRVAALRKDTAAAGAFGHPYYLVENADWRSYQTKTLDKARSRLTLTSVDGESPFVIHQVLLRTSAAIEIGGFDELYDRGCEDTEFWFRSLRSGHEYVDTQAQDCMYVQRAGSMVHQAVSHHVDTYMALLQANWRGHSPLPVAQRGPELTGPLPELSEQASMQRRAFKFLGMIATGGENAALPEALADALAAPRVISDETAREEMRLGAGRSLRRSGSENPRLLDEMLCAATTTFHRYMLGSPDPLLLPYQGLPQWALLMCDAEHLNGLDAALAPLPSSMLPMILVADSVTHNRGAADALARFPQWQVQSLAKFLLAGYGFSLVAAPDHDCEATEIVLAAASSRGSQVAKWAADPARPDVIALRQIGSLAVDRQPTGLRHAFVDFPVLSPMPSSLTDFSSG